MGERTIYFLFTDTGTYLSRTINYFTNKSLNHVSIGFDPELKDVYSFGRKQPSNPFSGGFVREDIRGDFLKKASCAIFKYRLSDKDYEKVISNIKAIEAEQNKYKYNFIGLIGFLLNIEINREYALFCSQFVARVMKDSETFQVSKPSCFVTPADIREQAGMELIYQGKLEFYSYGTEVSSPSILRKQSFIFFLSNKVKQFVMK
ncbi:MULTISPECIES: hypothetical protein [unclassified Virgibacillus]|uniref:hypothetical protein n=1 Tax=unclassified Virgibacillus TaxID=2620237 RepID=UPI0024DEFCF4|nr:hypothetical protein [Virgibacillus sp. LDC-1]